MRTVMYGAWSEMKWSIGKHSCLSNHRDMQHQLFRAVLCQASLIEVFKPSRNAFASSTSLVPSLTPSLIARSKSFTDFDWMNSWNSTMMLWGSGCKEMLDAESLLSIQGENHDDFIVADSHIYVPNLKDLSGYQDSPWNSYILRRPSINSHLKQVLVTCDTCSVTIFWAGHSLELCQPATARRMTCDSIKLRNLWGMEPFAYACNLYMFAWRMGLDGLDNTYCMHVGNASSIVCLCVCADTMQKDGQVCRRKSVRVCFCRVWGHSCRRLNANFAQQYCTYSHKAVWCLHFSDLCSSESPG